MREQVLRWGDRMGGPAPVDFRQCRSCRGEHAHEENLGLLGSGVLLRSLLAADLIDELQLSIVPLVLGTGTRLFAEHGPHLRLRLTESVTTTTGVVLATYRQGEA